MKQTILINTRRRLLVFTVAALLALGAAYGPVVLDSMASTTLTPTVYACGPMSGGC